MRHKQQRLLEQNIHYLETYIKDHKLDINPEEMILAITEADPDWQNFKNSKWLIKNLLNKNFLWEDIKAGKKSKAFDTLLRFLNIRKQWSDSAIKDIQAYKGLSGIAEAIRPFEITKSMGEIKREEKAKIYSETIVVYDKDDYLVVIPKTEEASCFWGRNTEWCTASTRSDNYFNHYHEDGPLIIAITPDNRKYQFHKNSTPMNENDEAIDNVTDPVLVKLALLTGQLSALKTVDYKNPEHLRLGLQINGHLIQDVSPDMENYLEFCKLAVQQNSKSIQHILPSSFTDSKDYLELCKLAVDKYKNSLLYILPKNFIGEGSHIEDYFELCESAIIQYPYAIQNIYPEDFIEANIDLKYYFKLCELAVQNNGVSLRYVSHDTEGYVELCKLAVQNNPEAISVISSIMEEYPELCKLAVEKEGKSILNIQSSMLNYQELCKIAVPTYGLIIENIPPETEGYVELCKLAVQNNGLALSVIDPENLTNIKDYFEICKLAVQQNGESIQLIPSNTFSPEEYLELSKIGLRNKGHYRLIQNIPIDDEDYSELCKFAVLDDVSTIQLISPETKDYFEICKLAVQNAGNSISYIQSKNFTNQKDYLELCKFAVQEYSKSIQFIPPNVFTNPEDYFEICRLAVQSEASSLPIIIRNIKKYPEIYDDNFIKSLFPFAKMNDDINLPIEYISPDDFTHQEDYLELCQLAVQNNKKSLDYISYEYHEELKSVLKIEDNILPDWLKNKDYDKIIDSLNLLEQENANPVALKHIIELL